MNATPVRRAPRRQWPRYAAAAVVVALVGVTSVSLLAPPVASVAVEESTLQHQANTITYQYRQAMAAIPVGAAGEGIGESDVRVNFGGVTFFSGDHLYADNTGIILSEDPLDIE